MRGRLRNLIQEDTGLRNRPVAAVAVYGMLDTEGKQKSEKASKK